MRAARSSWVPAAVAGLGLIALLLVPWIYAIEFPKSPGSVFEDVVTFGSLARLVGFLSDLGIAMWLAMTMLLLQGLHRRLRHGPALGPREQGFYVFGACLTLFLTLDDRLMIHEWLTERWGMPEGLIMAAYAVVLGWGLWRYAAFWRATSWRWIVVAAVGFALSAAIDFGGLGAAVQGWVGASWSEVFEDGAKWIGICALLLYVFDLTADLSAPRTP